MNIFVLDQDPVKAAEYHCNKHVVKMILESSQMLCGAHWYGLLRSENKSLSDFKSISDARKWCLENSEMEKIPPYAFTHVRHPCSLWTAESTANYNWHLQLLRSLLDQYTLRYKKNHKSEKVWEWLRDHSPKISQSDLVSDHPQCMPDECKVSGDPVQAYKNYYKLHKRKFAKWEPQSETPDWFKE